MNYLALLYPIKCVPDYDRFSAKYCEDVVAEIELLARLHRIEKRRDQMSQRTMISDSFNNKQHANVDLKSRNIEKTSQQAIAVVVTDSSSSDPEKKQEYHNNDITPSAAKPTPTKQMKKKHLSLYLRSIPPLEYVTEEIVWEITFNRSTRLCDAKLFFFAGSLWRASFGLNRKYSEYYYVVISPAQELTADCRLRCDFHLKMKTDIEDCPPSREHIRKSKGNYYFPAQAVKNKGFDKFISVSELHELLGGGQGVSSPSKTCKVELKLVLSTEVNGAGDCVGCLSGDSLGR